MYKQADLAEETGLSSSGYCESEVFISQWDLQNILEVKILYKQVCSVAKCGNEYIYYYSSNN
jgi:hypothetical protein